MHVLGLNWKLKDVDNHAFENGGAKPVTFPTNTVTAISADGNISRPKSMTFQSQRTAFTHPYEKF